jgi:hypothetical protein
MSSRQSPGPVVDEGDRVELIKMAHDPDPIPQGSQGTVTLVDDWGTIHVTWDSGRNLGLIPGHDRWRVIGHVAVQAQP